MRTGGATRDISRVAGAESDAEDPRETRGQEMTGAVSTFDTGVGSLRSTALSHVRICDLTGLLAGAGATRFLAAFGAQVIRVEEPLTDKPRWDFLRGGHHARRAPGHQPRRQLQQPQRREARRHPRPQERARARSCCPGSSRSRTSSPRTSQHTSWNGSASVGIGSARSTTRSSTCRTAASARRVPTRTSSPSVRSCRPAVASASTPDFPTCRPRDGASPTWTTSVRTSWPPRCWPGLVARNRTGKGQWIDFACVEAGIGLAGPELLDATVNGRPMRRDGRPNSNTENFPAMVPHGVYAAAGDDSWVAIACRDDDDWHRLAEVVGESWALDPQLVTFAGRHARREEIDRRLEEWTSRHERSKTEGVLRKAGVPVAQVAMPEDRIEHDPRTSEWNLWPTVHHEEIGDTRVEGIPIHLSETDWSIAHGGALPRGRQRLRVRRAAWPLRQRDRRAPRPRGDLTWPKNLRRALRPHHERSSRAYASWSSPATARPMQASCSVTSAPTLSSWSHPAVTRHAVTDRSSTTFPTPTAAFGGGTTTPRSAASCSTSTPKRVATPSAHWRRGADIVIEAEDPGVLDGARHRPPTGPSRNT